ncbi:MAG: carboxypeptidase regulatory-like domain-containing protein [Chitinophagaceae bacterium]
MLKRNFLVLVITLMVTGISMRAQVTTGAITGTAKDSKGSELVGASVEAIHEPSGTVYRTISTRGGQFNLPSLRVGGPYKVTVTFVGFKTEVYSDLFIQLGDATKINASLTEEGKSLQEVVVTGTGSRKSLISKDRKGASTNINRRLLETMPTLSRSITDFIKITPQSNGTSFAGQDNRFVNLTIDGSIFNNSFGLQALPGSQTNATPISLDALEEIQVNLSPYSLRDAGFTGASINAITKSGTNTFHGSVFYNQRNENYVGTKAGPDGKTKITVNSFDVKQYGASFGGPIIKNKLFFFFNGEAEKRTDPGTSFVADNGDGTLAANESRTLASDLDALSAYLKSKFNYDTGPYQGYSLVTKSYKVLAKIDWNINAKNKFSIRYNMLKASRDVPASTSGAFGTPAARYNTVNTMNFANNNYEQNNDIYSAIAQLNTRFSNKISNELIFGFTANRDYRAVKGALFPLVDILKDGDINYTSFGAEPFTPNNILNTDTWQASDNLTFYLGKHTLSTGVNFEAFKFFNSFTPRIQGNYVFKSLADFYTSADAFIANPAMTANPVELRRYIIDYSNLEGGGLWDATTKAKNVGTYIQDDVSFNEHLSITYGIRFDVPFFSSNSLTNPDVEGYNFVKEDGTPTKVSTGQLPSAKLMINPRFGFNYDVNADKKTQIRGGLGLFSGRPAFVFVSNAVGNNGMLSGEISQDNTTKYPFSPNIDRNIPPTTPGTPAPSYTIAPIEKKFRFPQVFRTNFAIDQKIFKDIIGSAEFMFTQSLSNIYYYNANFKASTSNFSGPDTRPRFAGSSSAVRINSKITEAPVLASRPHGQSLTTTFKIEKPVRSKGLGWTVAYNYGRAMDYLLASTIAATSWSGIRSVNGNNRPDLAYSDNDLRHRLMGSITYRIELAKTVAFQVSLFGQTQNQGRFSYLYSGDMNGDGVSGNDLMYIPKDQSEMNFEQYSITVNGTPKIFTVQEQKDAFETFLQQDSYLRNHRGEVAKRNGALMPTLARFDLSAVVELFRQFGKNRHTIQFRGDIFNFGNMINSKWGVADVINTSSPLAARPAVNNVPVFRVNAVSNKLDYTTYRKGTSLLDVWQAQLGVRYSF